MNIGETVQARLTDIAKCSATTDGVTRLPYTEEHRAALDHIRKWMVAAGLEITSDAACSLIGRHKGEGPALIIGSHQDTVRHGGRYDGIMGIAVGCAALEALRAENHLPPFPVEIVAFADEEGVRFPSAMVGSRALAGSVDPAVFDMADADGVTMGKAMLAFGGAPEAVQGLARDPQSVRAYLEVHIEQGPVLEAQGLALGVVTGICGIERNQIRFSGESGHAGTVPMAARRDALVAAGEFIHRIHDLAATDPDLRATIGTLNLHPAAVNAIPERCDLVLEIRNMQGGRRAQFAQQAHELGAEIAARRNTSFAMTRTYAQDSRPCADSLMDALDAAIVKVQGRSLRLPSGAGHDAAAMADLCDIAMMFVRCEGGLSHRPDEAVVSADLDAAVRATMQFISGLHAAP